MARTGIVRSPQFRRHRTGHGHPERPERLEAIDRRLEESGLLSRLIPIKPSPAERRWIETIHPQEYVRQVEKACRADNPRVDDADTAVCSDSFDVATLAVGGALALVDAVIAGNVDNGFAAVRPPGHHAERDRTMGFCLFNNVAIAARYAQRQHGLERVMILDWDVHHGNGTQHLFEEDPSVLYCSLHQYPHYPGTGAASETGRGSGEGATLNLPMAAGSGDAEWVAAFDAQVPLKTRAFCPDIILVSAGFDAHARDPLSQTLLSGAGFVALTERVQGLAARHCEGRLACLLEGGYDLEGLASSVESHLEALLSA
ncbi:MAG: histone deacetylase [Acidobacteria bacterium]|nr:histone deacetylase [Acidobacteriota bacterium]